MDILQKVNGYIVILNLPNECHSIGARSGTTSLFLLKHKNSCNYLKPKCHAWKGEWKCTSLLITSILLELHMINTTLKMLLYLFIYLSSNRACSLVSGLDNSSTQVYIFSRSISDRLDDWVGWVWGGNPLCKYKNKAIFKTL